MFRHFGLRGQKWMWQLANGFPATCPLSQKHLFPLSDKAATRTPRAELYQSASARFRERAPRCGTNDAQDLWGEAIAQSGKGWLSDPIPLAANGKPAA